MIDLRSDLVAPTAAMRLAMAEAETGDELFGDDPTTRRLEDVARDLLGKEAAIFMPTCTMANAVAVLAHVCDNERILMDVQSHIHRREMQPPALLSTLRPTFFDSPDGAPNIDELSRFCDSSPDPGLVCLETTHTWRNGRPLSLERLQEVAAEARHKRARIHLDGARLFYAAVALEVHPTSIAVNADSVAVSLCKGIGAPAGAILAGRADLIAEARSIRLKLGGTLRSSGTLAAAGLLAVSKTDLKRDIFNAQKIARALGGVGVRPQDFPTNVVLFDPSPLGLSGQQFADLTLESGVQVFLLAPGVVRLTTHSGLSDADVNHSVQVITQIVERHHRDRAV